MRTFRLASLVHATDPHSLPSHAPRSSTTAYPSASGPRIFFVALARRWQGHTAATTELRHQRSATLLAHNPCERTDNVVICLQPDVESTAEACLCPLNLS